MKKSKATEILGGTTAAAAEAIGITPQAYSQWPEVLPKRLVDRVVAAIARKHLPPALLGDECAAGEEGEAQSSSARLPNARED